MPEPLLFLSHAGVDTKAAQALKERIEAAPDAKTSGLRVWFDKDNLDTGRTWQPQLEEAIQRRSTAFAVYLGTKGVVNWVEAEVRLALSRATGDSAYRFIPIIAASASSQDLPGFTAQYQGVRDVENRPEEFEKLLRAVLSAGEGGELRLEEEPFFGLRAINEKRSHLFFGREKETEELVTLLRTEPLVMLTGDSGSGKSSLAKAGLVPAWHGGGLALLEGERPGDTVWHVVQMQPRSRPFASLGEGVDEAARSLGRTLSDRGTLADWAAGGEPEKVRRALRCDLPAEATRVLLLVDQFEELVTIAREDERKPFVDLLLTLADPGDGRVRVVLTMRRDYYNLLSQFPELFTSLEADGRRARHLVGRMSNDGLRRVVTEPLRLGGVSEGDREALAESVLRDVGERPGDLALVQMALTETWDARKQHGGDLLQAYIAVGRVEGAIAKAAEDVYTNVLTNDERKLAEPVFLRLVRLGETAGATRRVAAREEFDKSQWELVQKLASREGKRLLMVAGGEGETTEIAHEALVTQWPRYQTWLQKSAADKRVLDRLIGRAAGFPLKVSSAVERAARRVQLATGADLAAFRGVAERHPEWLSARETAFVEVSQRAAVSQRRRELRLFWSAVAAALVAFIAAGVAWHQRADALATTGRFLTAEAQRRLALPIMPESSPVIAALAATGWRINRTRDAWNALLRVPLISILTRIEHEGAVQAVAFSPDGRLLATASGGLTGEGKEARLIAVEGGQVVARIIHDSWVQAVAFSPDGRLLATASKDGTARLVAVEDGQVVAHIDHQFPVLAVAFSPDGKLLATAGSDGTARLVAVEDGHEVARIIHDSWVQAVAFSPDGRLLATASGFGWGSDGRGEARLVAVEDGHEVARIEHDGTVNAVAFSPDGRLLATGSTDMKNGRGNARLIAVENRHEVARIEHGGPVSAVAFSPDSRLLATGSWSFLIFHEKAEVRLVGVEVEHEFVRIDHDGPVSVVAFSPDGRLLATGSEDGTVRLLAVEAAHEIARIEHGGPVSAVAFSPDGWLLATASSDRTARLVTVEDGHEVARIEHGGPVSAVAFSPDGRLLATASKGGKRRLVAVEDGQVVAHIDHQFPVLAVAFSPDGRLLATGSEDGTVRLLAVEAAHEIARIEHGGPVSAVAFSPDGRLLATASGSVQSRKSEARLMAVEDGHEVALIEHSSDPILGVEFSPDGRVLAIEGYDGVARLVSIEDGHEITRFERGGPVTAVAFTPDGRLLAIAGVDGTVRLWITNLGAMLRRLCEGPGRNLSRTEWRRHLGNLPWQPTCENWPTPDDDAASAETVLGVQ